MHGVELVEAAIAALAGKRLAGNIQISAPRPIASEVLDTLKFPCGRPLSPALKRWLAFDASWLEWFESLAAPKFRPERLGAYAKREYAFEFGYSGIEPKFPGECYALPFGADSRRLLYVGEPDVTGEYPVLLLDTDDVPYIGVQYPGIDVYLGIHTNVIPYKPGTYGDLVRHRKYGARMSEHAQRFFDEGVGREIFDLGLPFEAFDVIANEAAASAAVKLPKKKTAGKPPKKKTAARKPAKPKSRAQDQAPKRSRSRAKRR